MATYTIRSLTRRADGRGHTTIVAVVQHDGPWSVGQLTHYFDHTPTVAGFGTVHHTVSGKGYLGTLRDPERFGDTFDDQWVSNYVAHRNQRDAGAA